jgi:hypothetical protein
MSFSFKGTISAVCGAYPYKIKVASLGNAAEVVWPQHPNAKELNGSG